MALCVLNPRSKQVWGANDTHFASWWHDIFSTRMTDFTLMTIKTHSKPPNWSQQVSYDCPLYFVLDNNQVIWKLSSGLFSLNSQLNGLEYWLKNISTKLTHCSFYYNNRLVLPNHCSWIEMSKEKKILVKVYFLSYWLWDVIYYF